MPKPLAVGQEGITLQPLFPRAELTATLPWALPAELQWPGSRSSSLAGANQKLTHLRVTGQKKSEKTQQVKGNLGPCLCLCPQIAPAELLGSCLPAHPYLHSPPEALSLEITFNTCSGTYLTCQCGALQQFGHAAELI